MNKRIIGRMPGIVSGFLIGVAVSLFVCLGVMVLLSIIKKLEFPEQEVLIFTVLFYGIIFFIAHSGVRAETRRNRALMSRYSINESPRSSVEQKSAIARVGTALWNAVAVISMAWLTPALIIYWAAPRHLRMAYATCCFLFSLVVATVYVIRAGKRIQTVHDKILYFAGVCSGALTVSCFFPTL